MRDPGPAPVRESRPNLARRSSRRRFKSAVSRLSMARALGPVPSAAHLGVSFDEEVEEDDGSALSDPDDQDSGGSDSGSGSGSE